MSCMFSNCYYLTTIDLSPLTSIEQIGNNFLYNSQRLTTLYLPNKSPTTFTTGGNYFMANVPADCILYTTAEFIGDETHQGYINTTPWSSRSSKIQIKP